MSIEKLTGQVMADDSAKTYYLALKPGSWPEHIGDVYLQEKLAGNTGHCLAIELYVRQAAIMYFHIDSVRDALAVVECYKAMRKPGTGGSKMHKDIAAAIELKYSAGDFERQGDGRIRFTIDSLRVTCKDLPGAVALVAAKYRRGMPRSGGGRYGTMNR